MRHIERDRPERLRTVGECFGAALNANGDAVPAGVTYETGSLRLLGGTIPVAPRPPMHDGQTNGRVVAMIRPESIKLVPTASCALCGLVESVNFIGDRQKASIAGAAEKSLTVDLPNTVAIKVGDRVGPAIEPSEIRLLPGDLA